MGTVRTKGPAVTYRWHLSITSTAKAMLTLDFCGELGREAAMNPLVPPDREHANHGQIIPVTGAPQPLGVPEPRP